jgi:hypothetical protein
MTAMAKSGESLSLQTIVIAAICVLVLVVLVIIFGSKLGLFGKNVENCESKGGRLLDKPEEGFACTPVKYTKEGAPEKYCCLNPLGNAE